MVPSNLRLLYLHFQAYEGQKAELLTPEEQQIEDKDLPISMDIMRCIENRRLWKCLSHTTISNNATTIVEGDHAILELPMIMIDV